MPKSKENAAALAEILLNVSRYVDAAAHASELNPAQWTALRYLSKAAPSARTNRAFATYHQTTTGTVAVTFRSLMNKGLIQRNPSKEDKRQAEFSLTRAGKELLKKDPCDELVRAIEQLPEEDRKGLANGMTELVLWLSARDPKGD